MKLLRDKNEYNRYFDLETGRIVVIPNVKDFIGWFNEDKYHLSRIYVYNDEIYFCLDEKAIIIRRFTFAKTEIVHTIDE